MSKTYIIAEAGVNHNGSVELAKKLIDVASKAGADAVKFQTFKAVNLVSRFADKADYQKETTNSEESQFDMIKKLELDYDVHQLLIDYSISKGIDFLSTPFDLESIDLLVSLGLKIFKIPSGEITNLPYLEKLGQLKREIVLSTGMSNLADIENAISVLTSNGTDRSNITVLHANTEYPTPFKDVNLKAMVTIGSAFNVQYGYSDHTLGIEVPIAAVALGAKVIEKHFTLDKTMEGPDHKASLEPAELKQMVNSIRNIELALGSTIKKASDSEKKNITIARKSIHINQTLKAGTILESKHFIMKRPGDGISPMVYHELVGRELKIDVSEDYKLSREDIR